MAINFADPLLDQCNAIWAATRAQRAAELNLRKVPPLLRLWDSEMHLQHVVGAEYAASFELIDGDTGPIEITHPLDHPAGRWLWDEQGRIDRDEGRNVNITVDYAGSRIGGMLDHVELELGEGGEQLVVARFNSDYERLKWYTVWSNPWLPE